MFQLTPVVKNLIIINVLFFAGSYLVLGEERYILGLFPPNSEQFAPYQLITHMFMHSDFTHILFNMFVLAVFGPMVEQTVGPQRMLILYFACGLGALLLHFGMQYVMTGWGGFVWGASGATMGISAAFATWYPQRQLMLLFPPIPVKAWILVSVLLAIDLFSGFGNPGSGIAHFAHVGGALVGVALTLVWKGAFSRR